MLLCEYPDHKKTVEKQKYVFIQPKLNGWRSMANTRTGEIFHRIKKTNELKKLNLPHISNEIMNVFDGTSPEWIDGEIYSHGYSLKEIQSMINRGDEQLKFHIFDCVHTDGFSNRYYDMLNSIDENSNGIITLVYTIEIPTKHIMEHYQRFLILGYEGAVVRVNKRPYEQFRSNQVLKMKPEIM